MMANTTFISFVNFFILRAVMGAVTPHGLMKNYNHPRLETVPIRQCMLNQFYDSDEGRCSIVPGGGTAAFIDSIARCEKEVVRVDLFNRRRYFICRASKTIYAECKDHQIFSRRLKRCIYDVSLYEMMYTQFLHYHHELPPCEESGRFPAPKDRQIFYTCTSNGFRLYRNIYSCPHSTAYNSHIQMCIDSDSYATGGFPTTEFPMKFITIMPKTPSEQEDPSKNSFDDTQSTIANDVFNSEETLQAVSIIPNERGKENFLQTYLASTTEMSNLDFQAYAQNTTVSSALEMTFTENILSNITPATIDTTNISNKIVSHWKRTTPILPEIYVFGNKHSTLETFSEAATEFSKVTEKILDEKKSILIKNDESNYGNIENEDSTKMFLKSTTEIVTEPISHTSTMNANNQGNYLETTASDAIIVSIETDNASNIPSTTPAAVRKVKLVDEIPVEEELTFSNFQIDPTTESRRHEFLNYPSKIYTSSVIPEVPSSSTTELTIADIFFPPELDTMIDNTSPLYSTTEQTK